MFKQPIHNFHEVPDLFFRIYDLNYKRQIFREFKKFCFVYDAGGSEPFYSAQNSRSRKSGFSRLLNDGFIQRFVSGAIQLAQKNSEQLCFT